MNTVGNRGYGISDALLKKRPQYDVLVFQEVFLDQGREELLKWLRPQYPYVLQQQAPTAEEKNFSFQFYDSGFLMLSKFPIRQSWYTKYSQSTGLDYLSDKGAVVALLDVPGAHNNTSEPVLVAGTHMQADGSRDTMKSQVDEMGHLLSQVVSDVMIEIGSKNDPSTPPPRVPLTVACGDFNIRNTRKNLYKYMLAGLSNDTVDTFLEKNPTVVDVGTTPGSKHRIDYVFHLREFGNEHEKMNRKDNNINRSSSATLVAAGIDRFAPETSVEGHAALSDHYGVWASFDLNYLEAGPPGPPPLTIAPMPTPSPTTPVPIPMTIAMSGSNAQLLLLGHIGWSLVLAGIASSVWMGGWIFYF